MKFIEILKDKYGDTHYPFVLENLTLCCKLDLLVIIGLLNPNKYLFIELLNKYMYDSKDITDIVVGNYKLHPRFSGREWCEINAETIILYEYAKSIGMNFEPFDLYNEDKCSKFSMFLGFKDAIFEDKSLNLKKPLINSLLIKAISDKLNKNLSLDLDDINNFVCRSYINSANPVFTKGLPITLTGTLLNCMLYFKALKDNQPVYFIKEVIDYRNDEIIWKIYKGVNIDTEIYGYLHMNLKYESLDCILEQVDNQDIEDDFYTFVVNFIKSWRER